MSNRAAIYARVSSRAQKDRQTVENQLRVLPDFVERNGWTLTATYVDDGHTAKAGHLGARDGLTRLMRDAVAGLFDVVAVVDLDRLTRSEDITERGAVIGAFQRAGIKIAIANSGQVLDLASSMGDLFSGLQGFFAAEENRKRRERTIAGKLRAIADGKKPAGPTPFGYSYHRERGWSISEPHAAAVREIFERIAAGDSCRVVAERLEDSGAPRPRGGTWARIRVYEIARSRTYLGEWVADRARGLTVKVPRLIEDELWFTTHRTLMNAKKRGLDRAQHVYLLAGGLATCELCGWRIGVASGSAAGSSKVRQTYYRCGGRLRPRGEHRCDLPYLEWHATDERLWSAVAAFLRRRDLVERALEIHGQARSPVRDSKRDAERAQAKLEQLARAEAAMLARFRRGAISEAAMDAELDAQARERAALERRIEAAASAEAAGRMRDAGVIEMQATLEGLRRRIDRATPEQRRSLVGALLGSKGLTVNESEIVGVVRLPLGQDLSMTSAGWRTGHREIRSVVLEFPLVA